MQNIILALAILLLTTLTGNGQCNRKVNWHASKAELLDEKGHVVDTREGDIVVMTGKSTITLSLKEVPNQAMEGAIKETDCEWKEVFKNGKTIYKTEMYKHNGANDSNGTFTIEAKDGKITILMEIEKVRGKKVRIPVDKYEEADNDLPVPRSIIDISTI